MSICIQQQQQPQPPPSTTPFHPLQNKWNLYYHLPQDKNWSLASYKLIMDNIDSVEKLLSLNEHISENIVKNCMLFVMKQGVTPMWEDKKNRDGGCFSFKVINKQVFSVWKSLFYALCGETLTTNTIYNECINGITISPKKNFCIIKIWLATCNHQDPTIITPIKNLNCQGCLFKKHSPEF